MNFNPANFDRHQNSSFAKFLYLHSHDRSFSFELLLQQQLLTAVIKYLRYEINVIERNFLLEIDKIATKIARTSLHLERNDRGYFYRSAVALSLTSYLPLSPVTIARQIGELFGECEAGDRDSIVGELLQFTLEINDSGWLDFYLDDRSIAIWFDRFLKYKYPQILENSTISENLFPLQYCYARCRSLLHLAAKQKIINLSENCFYLSLETAISIDPKNYLDRDDRLIFNDALELETIAILLKTNDILVQLPPDRQKIRKCAFLLCDSFLKFHSNYSLGSPQHCSSQSQARLGIITILGILCEKILVYFSLDPLKKL